MCIRHLTVVHTGAALLLALAITTTASAESASADAPIGPERRNTGWALYFDNDALASGNRDEGYTGGAALTFSGRRAREQAWSLDPVLGWFDGLLGIGSRFGAGAHETRHAISYGLIVFTPDDTDASAPVFDEHPYANVLYMGNTRRRVLQDRPVSYHSTFLAGLLGTDAGELVQDASHELLGFDENNGWDNQISDGGEPTFLYAVTRQQVHWADDGTGGVDYDVRSLAGGSLGYITEVKIGIEGRVGDISSPWWDFNPNHANYINLGTPVASGGSVADYRELFFWAGVQLRGRVYNALLEGQFRDSRVEFDRDELESLLPEASVGVTYGFRRGTRVTVALRARRQEIEDTDSSSPVWGNLTITRRF